MSTEDVFDEWNISADGFIKKEIVRKLQCPLRFSFARKEIKSAELVIRKSPRRYTDHY